jgi:hypothetical protein
MAFARSAVMLALLFLAACSMHSVPSGNSFALVPNRPAVAQVFLDINGSFYPSGWQSMIGAQRIQRHRSLLNATHHMTDKQALRAALAADEQRQLAQIKNLVAGKRRVFIITHGFNSSDTEARASFALVEKAIPLGPRDALIHVYWDGQIGKNLLGSGAIWFSVVGNSQRVGSRGLRQILNQMVRQEIILISHSRGASVVLSALANPPYNPGFVRKAAKLDFAQAPGFLTPPPLAENGNRIKAVFLAPAIGHPDFWALACQDRATSKAATPCTEPPQSIVPTGNAQSAPCPDYRVFPKQFVSLHYTTNQGDKTLKKYFGTLRRAFNPTDFGYELSVGDRLKPCLGFKIKGLDLGKRHLHDFALYARDRELPQILREILAED